MDHADIDTLYRAFGQDLLRFLRRRVASPETAADLVQDAFVRLLTSRPGADLRDARAYLFRTAANLAIDHQRRQGVVRMVSDPEALAAEPDAAPSPERAALSRQELDRLGAVVAGLPTRCREVFLLARIEGLSYAEIGERLGISPKTAFSHMVKALGLLATRMRTPDNTGQSDN